MTTTTTPRGVIETAAELTAQRVPVLPLRSGVKPPSPRPSDGSWWLVDDPQDAAIVFEQVRPAGPPNLGMLLGTKKDPTLGKEFVSPVLALSFDRYKTRGPEALAFAKSDLGLRKDAACWAFTTGRGGLTTVWRAPQGVELKRDTRRFDGALDLLVNGYTVCPPSNTSREADGGGPYTWLPGHSPWDIPATELDVLPALAVEFWTQVNASAGSSAPQQRAPSQDWFSQVLGRRIPEGMRNEELTRIAGKVHRLRPDSEARALLDQVNGSCCLPPLPPREVDGIWRSIKARPGFVPSFSVEDRDERHLWR